MRGKLLDGKKAAEIGLVTHAIPRDQVMDEALKPVFKGYRRSCRAIAAMFREAVRLVAEGYATVGDIAQAVSAG